MKKVNNTLDADQRNYFRIDDIVYLSYRVVSWEDARSSQIPGVGQARHTLTVKANLERISRELQPLHSLIRSQNSNVAEYLSALDKKINLIGEYLTENDEAEVDVEPQQVNIGAGGLLFVSDKPVIIGAMLELQMKMLPENTSIFSYARVVSCTEATEKAEQQEYKIAVEFEFMDEDVRDLITRHIFEKERSTINKKEV